MAKKELPVIEIPAQGKTEWIEGAYTIAFVFSKSGNFILKGYIKEVREYLKKNCTHYLANLTLWHHGEYRDIWQFWKPNVYVNHNTRKERIKLNRKRITIVKYGDSKFKSNFPTEKKIELNFKRLPQKWIPEYEQL